MRNSISEWAVNVVWVWVSQVPSPNRHYAAAANCSGEGTPLAYPPYARNFSRRSPSNKFIYSTCSEEIDELSWFHLLNIEWLFPGIVKYHFLAKTLQQAAYNNLHLQLKMVPRILSHKATTKTGLVQLFMQLKLEK